MKKTVPDAYKNTRVSTHKSRDEIEGVLLKYDCDAVMWQGGRVDGEAAMAIRFRRQDRVYRFEVDLGDDQQEERQRMRALYWGLKTMLEQAAFGILKFEDVFLAYSEVALPDGSTTTVGEVLGPQLTRHELPDMGAPLRILPEKARGLK